MSGGETRTQEGGPLERTHMKDMVQKNAMQSAALIKRSKHLDSQKKAFVRQNTRDEVEMKSLLYRLHVEQHHVHAEDGEIADEDGKYYWNVISMYTYYYIK